MENTNVTIKNKKHLLKVIEYCKQTGYCSCDFETNGYPYHHPLFLPTIISISFQQGSSYILELAHKDSRFLRHNEWRKLIKILGDEVIENVDIVKVAWNLKFEMNVFRSLGIQMKGRLFDAMLAKYLLKEERPNDLKSQVAIFIPRYAGYDLKGSPGKGSTQEAVVKFWSNVEIKELSKYCGLDADLTLRLMQFFEPLLIRHGFYQLFRNLLMMATRVLADSEYEGMPIDESFMETLVISYGEKIDGLEQSLHNNPKIKQFEKSLIAQRVRKAIDKVEEEIETLDDVIRETKRNKKLPKAERNKIKAQKKKLIATRRVKINKLIARDFTSQKDLKMLEPVNFGSPAQMADLFFRSKYGFKFKIVKYTTDKYKRETDNPSTDEDVLTELKSKDKSGFIDSLLEYRELGKLYSTYIIGIKERLSFHKRVHTTFLLHGTVTGRLSNINPNLQNMPRELTNSDIKKMFIPPPGKVLVSWDYSGAELRVLAELAKEEAMIEAFAKDRDIHLAVACKMHGYDYDEAMIWLKDEEHPKHNTIKRQRKYSKTISFGIIYGQQAKKLSGALECSIDEAKQFMADYDKMFPSINRYVRKQHKLAHKYGYVISPFGRKRRLPKIDSPKWGEVAEAERQSLNSITQGTASDFALFSSVLIYEKRMRGELPSDMIQCYTVHDSLGFFMNPKDVHWVNKEINKICENPETKKWFNFSFKHVRMKVDTEISHKNWSELRNYNESTDYAKVVKEYRKELLH